MSVPVLQPGDHIHMAVPGSMSGTMIKDLIKDYRDRGVTVFRASPSSTPLIEVISIIRAPKRPGPMDPMAAMPLTRGH